MGEPNWVIRKTWLKMDADATRKAYAEMAAVKGRGDRYRIVSHYHDHYRAPTYAQSYGAYALDMHKVYLQFLEILKSSRNWTAGIVHSTHYTGSPWLDVAEGFDAIIYTLDPWIVNCPWFDDTRGATNPDEWPVPLDEGDLDHYVFSTARKRSG